MLTLTLPIDSVPVAIPLPRNFSMPLTWKSPVCDFSKIPSGYSIEFSLPSNGFTRAIFGNPERFTKSRTVNDQKFEGFEVRFKGELLKSGTLTINGFTPGANGKDGTYNASLLDNVGVLAEQEQQRDILEITDLATPVDWVVATDYTPETSPYCLFAVNNPGFFNYKGTRVKRTELVPDPERIGYFKDAETETEVLKYCFAQSNFSLVNACDYDSETEIRTLRLRPGTIDLSVLTQFGNTYEVGEVSVISPFFYLGYILRKLLKSQSFHLLTGAIDTNALLKKLVIYNNFDITGTVYNSFGDLIYQSPSGENLYNGNVVPIDMYSSAGHQLANFVRSYAETVIPRNHVPKMKMGDALLSTQNLFNICFHFLPNSTVNSYSREDILTGAAIDLDRYFLGTWTIGEKKNVALKFTRKHDDNDLIFSEGHTDLSDRRADIKDPVADFASLFALVGSAEGDIRFVNAFGSFFEYKWITQSYSDAQTREEISIDVMGWEKISIGLQDGWYEYGRDEVEEIATSWSTLWAVTGWAATNQAGNMNGWKAKTQAFAPRLMIQNSGLDGGGEIPDFSFEYEKPTTGILAKFWKNWNPFWANRLPVIGEFDLPLNVLRHVAYNICSKFRTREGEFLIEEMSATAYLNYVSETEVKAYKIE